jgi:hypothetical protein
MTPNAYREIAALDALARSLAASPAEPFSRPVAVVVTDPTRAMPVAPRGEGRPS